MKSLKKIASKDTTITQLQNNVEAAVNPIIDKVIVDGILLKNINLTTGIDNIINHKLGRALIGYTIVSKSSNSNIWNTQQGSKTITLQCSLNTIVNIWVF